MEEMEAGDDYAKAQRILDDGLLAETNQASNDTSNKVGLLRFRAFISQLQDKSKEALEALEEAYRLEDSSGKLIYQKARDAKRSRKGRFWSPMRDEAVRKDDTITESSSKCSSPSSWEDNMTSHTISGLNWTNLTYSFFVLVAFWAVSVI
jgi:hypothetical protein